MKILLVKLANLINVKTIVTFVVTGVFAILALRGTIASEVVMPIVIMVLTFYFGTQHEQTSRAIEKNSEHDEHEK